MVLKMLYVTDAHALFGTYLIHSLKESTKCKSAERGESTIFVPTIVLAECFYLVEKGKIDLNFYDFKQN